MLSALPCKRRITNTFINNKLVDKSLCVFVVFCRMAKSTKETTKHEKGAIKRNRLHDSATFRAVRVFECCMYIRGAITNSRYTFTGSRPVKRPRSGCCC